MTTAETEALEALKEAAKDEGHAADSGYNCDVCRALARIDEAFAV